jgi:hypothetical protein
MTKMEVTCPKCGHKFWMEDYENKACPNCGFLVRGPKGKTSASGPCFITTACVEAAGLPDNCTELETMKYLRDEYLAKSDEGKRMVQEYYEIAPSIVEKIRKEENSNEVFSGIFNAIRGIVSLIEIGDLENATEHYKEMVLGLKRRYLTLQMVVEGGERI